MEILNGNQAVATGGTAVALGYFDGVHLGHQSVIGAMLKTASQQGLTPAVFTFTLPTTANTKGRRLQTDAMKNRALESLGVQLCIQPPFASFQNLAPEEFFTQLTTLYKAKAIFCGPNFQFGRQRAGNTALLRQMCEAAGIQLHVIPLAEWEGEPVSSSRIRKALYQGDIPAVNAMLGRPYAILLPVQHGRGIGSTMGFPTINQIYPAWMQQPAFGVYVTKAVVGQGQHPSVTGFGNRPTVNGAAVTCETFLPGFEGDLYGKEVELRFYKKIDETQRFASTEELSRAVQAWASEALAWFSGEKP